MTKHEIIDYVVNHFKENPRARSEEGRYQYIMEDGRRCGHSICIKDSLATSGKLKGNALQVIQYYGDEIHKPEFRGHSADFWRDVQKLHDITRYWETKKGGKLSVEGEDYGKVLKDKMEWKII